MNYLISFSIILEYIHIHILQLKEMSFRDFSDLPKAIQGSGVQSLELGADCLVRRIDLKSDPSPAKPGILG